ncbi:amidohydrolase family protein [Desulfuromonas sp. KJ2020]|uniref:amidohydrolase family protein n=1 Tax=Desulfuromonas sp. KJ2020 TaxID=2919173 RepID=UPI0020A82FF7|nr:amidohydrolase family protein [Desulfuromonas sp. KJ2020]MCP3177964.1 amidohydrolase family protein [Desulfuromonas sp. KJ2020]
MVTLYAARFVLPISAPPLEDGAIAVRDGRLLAVGSRPDLAAVYPQAHKVDFPDGILLPPLVNAHTHLELTHFSDWARRKGETATPASFVDWILQVVRVKRGLDPQLYLPSLEDGIQRCLAAGTGAVGDILSWFPARLAYRQAPLFGTLFLETLGRHPEQGRRLLHAVGDILREGMAGHLTLGLSPHSPYTLSDRYMEEVVAFARRQQAPLSIHLGESAEERAFLDSSVGDLANVFYPYVGWHQEVPPPAHRTPASYLNERGGLLPSTLLAHGVQVDEEDIRLLRQKKVTLALCPRSNARLGVGKAPVALYRQAGVPLVLGTDSLASCDTLSIWDEMVFALDWFGRTLTPAELLRMATSEGARALGLEGEMGCLQAGYGAHFQILRPQRLPCAAGLLDFLCQPGRSEEVSSLYLCGRDVLQKA